MNLHHQSKHWPRCSVKMETLTSFAVQMEARDTLMSWDIKSGYRHLCLNRDVQDVLLLRYSRRFYRCVALQFGWGPSALWFTKLMRPVVQFIRDKWCWRVLPYLDGFLLDPSSPGRPSTTADCAVARVRWEGLLGQLGLSRHPSKGCSASTWTQWPCTPTSLTASAACPHSCARCTASRPKEPPAGAPAPPSPLLRGVRFADARFAAGALLQPLRLFRHGFTGAGRVRRTSTGCASWERSEPSRYQSAPGGVGGGAPSWVVAEPPLYPECPPFKRVASRLGLLARFVSGTGAPVVEITSEPHHAQRRSRRGDRRYAGRYKSWYAGFMGRAGFLDRGRQSGANHAARTASSSPTSSPGFRALCLEADRSPSSPSRRQRGSSVRKSPMRWCQPPTR